MINSKNAISEAVDLLLTAESSNEVCSPIREIIGSEDITTAYAIQQQIANSKLEKGEKIVGKKIGLTSFAVQKQLGVDQPDYGILWASKQVKNGGTLKPSDVMQPKVEAEIAFVMSEDFIGNFSIENLISKIDYACISIEIVGSRIRNWDIRITDTIADNASASHFVLGDQKVDLSSLDLVNCKMNLKINGELVSEGSGKACMDNPLNAALWLAKEMARNNNPLRKGEVLLSGALGPMANIKPNDKIEAEIEGLGTASFTFK